MTFARSVAAALALVLGLAGPAAAQKRPLAPEDIYNVRSVGDPQRSPDGYWIAYTVSRAIKETDKNDTDVWMVSWDGAQHVQLTSSAESESHPRWSPDNKWLAFLSSRQEAKDAQLWLMNRLGGEAIKVTEVKGGIEDFAWSPDSTRIVLVVDVPDPRDKNKDEDKAKDDEKKKTPPPIVIDRYYFKEDVSGYLRGERTHLSLFDVASRKVEPLTTGTFNESSPSWSPDGKQIAFVTKRGPGDPDRGINTDIYLIDARAGAQPRALTTSPNPDGGRPAWSPDGQSIAYIVDDELKYYAYSESKLAVIPVAGGQPRVLTQSLDRAVTSPSWSPDGSQLTFIIEDDRSDYVGRVPAAGGTVEKVAEGDRVINALSPGSDGNFAVLLSTDTELPEVAALDGGQLRRLTHHNDDWLSKIQLATVEEFSSTSKDGTEVHGLLFKPPAYRDGQKYPTLLRIHGGPNGQDEHSFDFERQLFATHGYVVLAVNYRGSSGRGSAYQKAIFADWGGKEVIDLLGAMDYVQKIGLADPDRLGIGGWSYGGISTNYTIASDPRFKAAISGAGSSNQLAMYGVDEYVFQYENELGPPWKNPDVWLKVSYPFFHADRIRTPTLFMGGDKDFNVPLIGGEQMYQALRSLGVDTELVIYPNQYHGITVPSYRVDRLQRYLAWYDKYLKPARTTTTTGR